MKHPVKPFIKIALLTLTAIASSGWIGDGLKGECLFAHFWNVDPCGLDKTILLLCIALFLFMFASWKIIKEGQKLFYINLQPVSGVKPHRVLIMAVSSLNPRPQENENGDIVITDKRNGKCVTLTGNIKNDIEAFTAQDFKVNTQQLLRAVEPHLAGNTLKRVFLIGSEGEDGSFTILETVNAMLLRYDANLIISVHGSKDHGIRFEDVESLRNEYEALIEEAKKENHTENDIILDATGGQKTASIAAAMTTFGNGNLKFQYVETGGNNPKVLTFNIVTGIPSKAV